MPRLGSIALGREPMPGRHAERIPVPSRLRRGLDYDAIKAEGRAVRGQFCLVLVLERADLPIRIGFIASKRSVGNSVQRNRARRRLREIVRRRFALLEPAGRWLAFVALRGTLTASHTDLVADVERVLTDARALPR